jgi:hypothetical protein
MPSELNEEELEPKRAREVGWTQSGLPTLPREAAEFKGPG